MQVAELGTEDVMDKIEDLVLGCVKSIMAGEGFTYTIPTRSEGNQMYVKGTKGG
jgi:meiotic recombination protein SPO11